MLNAYYTLLSSLMLMMLGITIRTYQTELFSSSIFGIIIIIFAIFMLAKTSYKTLVLLYIIPIVVIVAYHFIFHIQISTKELADYGNPAVILLGALILSHVQERMRFKEFSLNYILNQEKIRSEKLYQEVLKKTENLEEANVNLEHKTHEIEAQRDEILSQRDLVIEQNQHIEKQNRSVADSITYAQKIQQAVLPNFDNLKFKQKYLSDSFIIYKPKDQVSGDFYWADEINGNLIVAVADCTGHGVPGAFLSMLGVSFLNEIINRQKELSPGQILDRLRRYVKDTLNQTGERFEARDGMSMGLVIINPEKKTLQYAGAYIPLYLYRNKHCTILKADRNPIGIHYKEIEAFTNHTINLEKNDSLYLFTDGYADQFNTSGKEKFKISRFKNLLSDISDLPLSEQKIILEKSFIEWKGENEQIDDVTIVGLKL
jgi:serine phosphatase RsbU (regulator of sigma subunit)